MNRFAALLDRLVLTPQRNGKIRLLTDYFATTPDPDRGYAVAAITRDLNIAAIKPAMLRTLAAERVDEALFEMSYDYIGDLAETIALIWPDAAGVNAAPALSEVVETIIAVDRAEGPRLARNWLDALDASGRWALIKLFTGGLRIGVSSRLAKQALAEYGDRPVNEIEELWHGLAPPYDTLFAWLERRGEKPVSLIAAPFRPAMLAHAIDPERDFQNLDPEAHLAEWKWDGVRVQAVSDRGEKRLYSRSGDDISGAFPDVLETLDFDGAIDGELLVFDPAADPFAAAPFSDLQKRLNRKTVSKKLRAEHPAFIRAYDLLHADGVDLRASPIVERRRALERFFARHNPQRMDLSPLIEFNDWATLTAARAAPPEHAIEGVMIKRAQAPYTPGRPKGDWWKWKRDPYVIDTVLLYAQRGHGKRSSFHSDFTFGVWRDREEGRELVPVGKAYSGYTDEELKKLDRFVRENTTDRFGPVRQVRAEATFGIVLEIAFEGLNRSTRHKSGVAMRFPRIHRIRWDKPPSEADHLTALETLLPD